MTFITGITHPNYIRNLVPKRILSGESFFRSTLSAQLIIHSIAIVLINLSNHEQFQETSLFSFNASPLTISVSASIEHCIQRMLNRNERQRTFHRFASQTNCPRVFTSVVSNDMKTNLNLLHRSGMVQRKQ